MREAFKVIPFLLKIVFVIQRNYHLKLEWKYRSPVNTMIFQNPLQALLSSHKNITDHTWWGGPVLLTTSHRHPPASHLPYFCAMEPPYLREHVKKCFPPEQTSPLPHESLGTGHYRDTWVPSSLPCAHPTHAQMEAARTPELHLGLRNVKAELRREAEWPFHMKLLPTSALVVQLKECLPPSPFPTWGVPERELLPWINKHLYRQLCFWPLRNLFLCLFFRISSFTYQLHSLLAGISFSPVLWVAHYLRHMLFSPLT